MKKTERIEFWPKNS